MQSRAAGLGRAVLDSFPLIKFGAATQTQNNASPPKAVDLESGDSTLTQRLSGETGREAIEMMTVVDATTPSSSDSRQELPAEAKTHDNSGHDNDREDASRVLNSIGKETCPICMVDFENGDDLRVLPCEGRHQFHQECVDPWLLELSSSCPICRAGACSHAVNKTLM